ncbi:hypothetical protein NP233_g4262 [Leucocoprinus birnbaumii]|uniref:Phytase A n=1 Tax=Leucocoprinus birnbaumii TaxID=56174 RepID=A0AAD5YS07_9AGAR|nr:hypothetical protein NP233_g4262 [Leucocoprinus birnbaumii]
MNRGENNQLSRSPLDTPKDTDYYDAGAPFAPYETQKLWAAYSPYYSVQEYKPPPEECHLTQVNILQRHGARYPTLGQSARIATALMRLQEAVLYTDAHFEFIKNYEYDLNTDDLLPFGEHQMSESGRKSFVRYANLANEHNIPYVRASGSDRVIQSTVKWIDGFRNGSGGIIDPPLALVIPEIKGYNNTLDDKSCPNADHPDAPMDTWQNIYAKPIADRFNSIARGMPENITSDDAQALITLCALETVAKEKYSSFCNLFTQSEFEDFEYAVDLDKFYFTGYGSALGPVQGVGYINELLARLTDQPVEDHTQTNYTLDSNPTTFPLGRGIYVDMSHDNLMVAVFSAMGLVNFNGHKAGGKLEPTKRDESRDFVVSRIVPFSGRMVVERMDCEFPGDARDVVEDKTYVRILLNDAVQTLDFCEGVRGDGLCPLRSFVESQAYARGNGQGDWERLT